MNKLWTEKYRPTSLKDYIFSKKDTHDFFTILIDNQEIPHLLISGIQGTGKTTIARILANELGIKKTDVKTINASSERGIANVRETIEPFCKTLGFSKFKIVLLEEADGLSHDAQKALRSIIEENEDNARFILTCNYPSKIIPALHSRLQHVHIDTLEYDNVVERVVEILEKEDINVPDIDLVTKHIDTYYPDMRKIINSLQQSSMTGTLVDIISQSSGSTDIEAWEECWKTKPDKDKLIQIAQNIDLQNVDTLYRIMYNNVNQLKSELRDNAYVTIADHLYKSAFVADQEINLIACIVGVFND